MQDLINIYQQQPWLLFLFVGLISLCIGSFLNVVIYRLPIMLQMQWQQEAYFVLEKEQEKEPEKFNLSVPNSSCPKCKAAIKPWHNIPVLSYLMLLGKCHSCKAPISIRYPLVEAVTALVCLLLLAQFGMGWQFVSLWVLTLVFIALIGIDFDHQLLPDNLTLPLMWLGLLLNTQTLFVPLLDAVWGAAAGYLTLWSIFWLFKLVTGKDGMGYGDFKLLAVCGAWFGWAVLPNIILLSSAVGAVLGIVLIVVRGRDSQQPMPFGPFIAIAAWLTVVYPQWFTVTDWIPG
ncbi:MAG: prepilin peptidase [Pseudomonadales bacterium]|nr:prepilin peptidase [Pseudomonadales bacterium]